MKQYLIAVATSLLALSASLSQAAIVGDVSGGGVFNDAVEIGDGWGVDNGLGVDFWTITVGDNTPLNINVSGDFNYGISIFEGTVDTDFLGAFDNDASYSYMGGNATYVTGTSSLFGPFNTLDTVLASAGTYTIAVGGVSGLVFGSSNYSMNVQAVPVPAAAWLFGSALLALSGIKRRR